MTAAHTSSFREWASSALRQRFRRLSVARASPRPLVWFRIALAGVLIVQALSLIGHVGDLFGRDGLVAWSVIAEDVPPAVPNLAWLDTVFPFLGGSTDVAVSLAFALYVGGLFALFLGYRTRIAAALAWLVHTALLTSGELSMYGVDRFAQIGLFYAVWFPVAHGMSLDRAAGRVSAAPSFEAWLALRVLQIHVCLAYVASGVEKALGEQWWTGEAVWRAVMGTYDPPFDCSFIATIPGLAVGLGWMTLLLEAGVIAFVWHRYTRWLWLAGIVGMHLGIALVMNLWTFSATMIVFDIAAFGVLPQAGRADLFARRELSRRTDSKGGIDRGGLFPPWPLRKESCHARLFGPFDQLVEAGPVALGAQAFEPMAAISATAGSP